MGSTSERKDYRTYPSKSPQERFLTRRQFVKASVEAVFLVVTGLTLPDSELTDTKTSKPKLVLAKNLTSKSLSGYTKNDSTKVTNPRSETIIYQKDERKDTNPTITSSSLKPLELRKQIFVPKYGLAGYAKAREILNLSPETPVYSWGFKDGADNDKWLMRQSCILVNNKWEVRPEVAEFAKAHPGNIYFPLNEPTYCWPIPTTKELAELTRKLQLAVGSNGLVLSPAFAQTEIGKSWWGNLQYDKGPDGKIYDYAEAWARWMKELYGPASCPSVFNFHAYPPVDGRRNPADEIADIINASFNLADRVKDAFVPNIQFALTEVGFIKATCAGGKNSPGWDEGKQFMLNLTNVAEKLPEPGLMMACWFIPFSEACNREDLVGGWPGYLVYSKYDPNGKRARVFEDWSSQKPFCEPYYFSLSQMCLISEGVEEANTPTPLGKLWTQIANAQLHKQYVPII